MDDSRISHILSELRLRYSLVAITAAELECYVDIRGDADGWWQPLQQRWLAQQLPLLRIEKERGTHQYELVLGIDSAHGTANTLEQMRRDIAAHAHETMTQASFTTKPYEGEPASGLHLHLHLQDEAGANLFTKDEEILSDALNFSIGGTLACMGLALPFYCPHSNDTVRFNDADHVPRGNCWGANNRYCAVRIPSTQTMYDKHIELRVPSSGADPYGAMAAFLASVLIGLDARIAAPPQEFGKPAPTFISDIEALPVDAALTAAFTGLLTPRG